MYNLHTPEQGTDVWRLGHSMWFVLTRSIRDEREQITVKPLRTELEIETCINEL